jgi:hypothetical protein
VGKVKSLVVCAIERMEVNDAAIIAVLAAYPQMHNITRFSATVPIFCILPLFCFGPHMQLGSGRLCLFLSVSYHFNLLE